MKPDQSELPALFGLYQPIDGVRLNIAVDASGSVAGKTGTSNDISNSLDRALLVELRKQADVIVTSGATARAENLRPSKHAPIVVLSQSGEIGGLERLLTGQSPWPVTLIVPGELVATVIASLKKHGCPAHVTGLPNLEPSTVRPLLGELGYKKILLEVGPTLARLWTKANAVDEVCLTTTSVNEPHPGQKPPLPSFIESAQPRLMNTFYSATAMSRFERWAL